jgi:signal transduction histidine kinase
VKRPSRLDWGLAAFALATALVGLAIDGATRGSVALNVVASVSIVVPLAWWRTAPLPATVWLLVAAALAEWQTSAADQPSIWFSLLALSWGLGAHESRRRSIAGVVVLTSGIFVTTAITGPVHADDVVFPSILAVAFCLAGRTAHSRARLAGELHEEAALARERRAAQAESAVAEERRRIAREMHDVVAHSVSVMVVQAGGARRILARDPARAKAAAQLIAGTGAEAIVELERLLGVLHVDPAPAPTLDGIDVLVKRARAAGLPVDLEIDGDRRTLPAGVELAAYRVLQKAITNASSTRGAPRPTFA